MARGGREHVIEATHIPKQGPERTLDHELDSDRRSQVEATVDRAHQVVDELLVGARTLNELDVTRVDQVLNVFPAAGTEIVEDHYLVAAGGKGVGEM